MIHNLKKPFIDINRTEPNTQHTHKKFQKTTFLRRNFIKLRKEIKIYQPHRVPEKRSDSYQSNLSDNPYR